MPNLVERVARLLPEAWWSGEYHRGTVLANRLGLQVARTIALNTSFRLQSQVVPDAFRPYVDRYDRDGILVIPDFLPTDVFARIVDEYHAARQKPGIFKVDQCTEDNGVLEDTASLSKSRVKHFPTLHAHIAENEWLRSLGGYLLRRPETDPLSVIVSVIRKAEREVTPGKLVGSNYIHADVHFPTVKAWLYLSDVDESNGAFVFARGSHHVTLGRLLYEYEASVRVAKANQNGATRTHVPYGLARMPTPQQLARMGIREEPICGKANTLVVATVMGFHRRGEFQDGRAREVVNIRFKRTVPLVAGSTEAA